MHISVRRDRPAFAHDSSQAVPQVDFAASYDHAPPRAAPPRPNWIVLGLIALAHIAVLALVIEFDVIQVRHKPLPLVLHIVPVEIAPPPLRAQPPRPRPETSAAPIVAPPPVVATPTPPPPVVVTAEPPFQPAVAPAPPSPPARPAMAPTGPVEIGRLSPVPGNPPFKYPVSARMKHQEGVVRLRILVGTDGRVEEVSLAQSSGFDSLDKSAMDAIRRWRFVPPTRDGVAVEGIGIFPATFTLA